MVTYRDAQGKPATHHFDFRAQLANGDAWAVAVRPLNKVRKYRFDRTLELIAAQLPKAFASRVLLFTEADIPRPTIVLHAPTTMLIERAKELSAPILPVFIHMIIS